MKVLLNPNSIEDYRLFLKIKQLPIYDIQGREAWFPDEYAQNLSLKVEQAPDEPFELEDFLFDYQKVGASLAIKKRKFALFWRPGLGKTLSALRMVKHARKVLPKQKRCLIISPLMVIDQTLEEAQKFYPELAIEQVKARDLKQWMKGEGGIGITNYEALTDEIEQGNLGCLVLDESSLIKSSYGKWGQVILRLGRGIEWKLCLTGTPAPNDRIEYANHAVFLDYHKNVNSFLAKYFINRGETNERWEMKPHATEPFYRAMSHWAFFLNDPTTYGYVGDHKPIPPIRVHVHDYDMTNEQVEEYRSLTNSMCVVNPGGIGSRSKLSQLAKGKLKGKEIATNKFEVVKQLLSSWEGESTIVWCKFNEEQERMAREIPTAASIDGKTPHEERMKIMHSFKRGETKTLLIKPRIAQYGLNLQIVTKHIWSTLQDSWEEFWQGCCRSNRVGSTKPLDVYIPINDLERPMVDNVLRKAHNIEEDMKEQESVFKRCGVLNWLNQQIS